MTNIEFKKKGFIVSGHAMFSNYGNDIVCSAISITTIGVINEIVRNSSESNINLVSNEKDGLIDFEVIKLDDSICVLLEYFKNTMKDLESNYSNNVKIIN